MKDVLLYVLYAHLFGPVKENKLTEMHEASNLKIGEHAFNHLKDQLGSCHEELLKCNVRPTVNFLSNLLGNIVLILAKASVIHVFSYIPYAIHSQSID
jgi:hypothetical protein